MRKLGARTLPVVAKGDRWLFAANLRDLAAFLDVSDLMAEPLPADELLRRWLRSLHAARRFAGQLPVAALTERVIAIRPRKVGVLGVHIFNIPDVFLHAVTMRTVYDSFIADVDESEPLTRDPVGMVDYATSVIERLEQWQKDFTPAVARKEMPTLKGPQAISRVMERSTIHSMQHTRQLQYVLEQTGATPDGPLDPKDFVGLPMPERLFE